MTAIDMPCAKLLSYYILCFLEKQALRNARKACFYGLFSQKKYLSNS